jgi:hypothetical protein
MRFKAMVRLLPMVPVVSLIVLGPGCGDAGSVNQQPAGPATTQAQNDSEAAARKKAFGAKTVQTTKGPVKPASK